MEDSRARACRDVETPACYHRCRRESRTVKRGRPQLRGVPGLGQRCWPATGPRAKPRSSRGPGGRRPHPGDQRRGRRPDRRAAQGTRRAGPGRRPGHDRLAPGSPPPGTVSAATVSRYLTARPGHPRTEETAEVLLPSVRSRAAEPMLAVRLHPLPARRRHRTPRSCPGWMTIPGTRCPHRPPRVSGPIVVATFRAAVAPYGIPASTLTDIQDVWRFWVCRALSGRRCVASW